MRSQGLVKRYDRTVAVAGLDLAIEPGEIFGLVGPNGAGKTTTLRMLATLLRPSAGTAEIDGWSVTGNPDEVRRVIGFMPDVFGVYDDMKVWEYLDFFARCYGLPAAARRRMIADLLELVDLGDRRDDYVQTLSRGMEQRLCLAHALVHDPKVLLLDEPASGLDPRARVELRELLRELRALGKTILISSHILPELEELCTSVAIVDHGKVLAAGSSGRTSSGGCASARSCGFACCWRARHSRRPVTGSGRIRTWRQPRSSQTDRSNWASAGTTRRPPGCWRHPLRLGCRSSPSPAPRAISRNSSSRVTAPERESPDAA